MKDINVREAFFDDAQILAYIIVESWRAAFSDIISPRILAQCTRLEQREEVIRSTFRAKIHEGLICEKNGSPCGAIIYESNPGPACEIVAVHSVEASWGTGCGRAMMEEALKRIKEKNCTHAFLWVFCENRRARRFYEKCGFVPDGAQKDSGYGLREMRYVTGLK